MNRLDKLSTKALIKLCIEMEKRKQKKYAVEKTMSIGVRATSRLLHVPRRTIQRWLRKKTCPPDIDIGEMLQFSWTTGIYINT